LLLGLACCLLAHRDSIIAAIASVIRRTYAQWPNAKQLRRFSDAVVSLPRLVAFRGGKRGPPRDAPVSGSFSHQPSRGTLCYTCLLRHAASLWGTFAHRPASRLQMHTSL
jgi:hypothetical protein